MSDRPGFDQMQTEIAISGGRFGGAWAPLDLGTYCPRAIEYLLALFPIRTVLDVGCGFGSHLRLFRAMGCQAVGVEPLRYAAERSGMPVIRWDLEAGPLLVEGIDLAFSVEAAEHVKCTDNFCDTMANGKVAVFSAAPPGMIGHNHVSCYPQEDWQRWMRQRGFTFYPRLSQTFRDLAGGYVGMTGMVFVKNEFIEPFGLARGDYD